MGTSVVEDLLTLELAKAASKTPGINSLKVVENRPFFSSIKCNNFFLKEGIAAQRWTEVIGLPKGNAGIGKRMVKELFRIYGTESISVIYKHFGCSKYNFYEWRKGVTPGGYWLAKLNKLGGDVIYVLSGKRGDISKFKISTDEGTS